MYRVFYDPKAEKQLEKCPHAVRKRIILKIRSAANTGRNIEPLKTGLYKIRIGSYRAIVDVTKNPLTLWVRFIGQRHNVYKQ